MPETVEFESEPAEIRRERLAALVTTEGFVSVSRASELFGVSDVTVRSDLAHLDSAGAVRRVRGGAVPLQGSRREESLEKAIQRSAVAKQRIGIEAARMVEDGQTVVIDVGSTTREVAAALAQRGLVGVTVVTNGLTIATTLEAATPRTTVVVTGGTLRPLQHSLVNPLATETLRRIHVDIAFIGASGLDDDGVVSNLNLEEAEVKRAYLERSARSVLVLDGSKVPSRHLATFADIGDFDDLVTDDAAHSRVREIVAGHATRLHVVS
jgi:DeoR family transcriptional regulator of aga operon